MDRLYQELARGLLAELTAGIYGVGDRLPAERELSARYQISRPTVREAIISLEVQGFVEVRVGSGAYVKRLPGVSEDAPAFNITAFEITEARLLFEGEAAALAASQITDDEIAELETCIQQIAVENQRNVGTEQADRTFHVLIAQATRNAAIVRTVEDMWDQRANSPDSALLYAKARSANIKPVVDEHSAILDAMRSRDPNAARAAMRTHLSAVLDSLLFATEERAIEAARLAAANQRARYSTAS